MAAAHIFIFTWNHAKKLCNFFSDYDVILLQIFLFYC